MFKYIRIAIILLALGLTPLNTASAQGLTIVKVSAPTNIDPGEQFTVNINVEPGTAIAGVQFNLAYNPSVVTVKSVIEGDLLSQGGAITYFNAGKIDNIAGTIKGVAGAIMIPGQSVNTPGTFAVITFTAGTQRGTSPLTLSNVVVGDVNGQAVSISVVSSQVTSNLPPDNGGGGGGGGGGAGGGGGGGGGGITTLLGSITDNGTMINEVIATDNEQKVKLVIPKGTVVKNSMGQKASYILIQKSVENPATGGDFKIIIPSYYIQPDGTTFNPAATLVFQYSDPELPEGVPEHNLYVAQWDPSTTSWIDLGGTVDPVANTVSVPIEHLSKYALMARTGPATFEFSDLTLSSKVVAPGESLNISVLVANTGDLTGSLEVSLIVDEESPVTKTVTLDGGTSEIVNFNVILNVIGEHRVNIGNLTEIFTVKNTPAPTFTVSNLVISPAVIYTGDNISISALVTNTSEISGTYRASLQIDGVEVQTKEIVLDAGVSREVVFNIRQRFVGQHTVNLGSLQAIYTVQVLPPTVSNGSVSSIIGISGFTLTPVHVSQTGQLASIRVEYRLDGAQEQIAGSELTLKVFYEGVLIEGIRLPSVNSSADSTSLNYSPSTGWKRGVYSFQIELYEGDIYIQSSELKQFTVTPGEIATTVSWKTLGIIIGVVWVLAGIIIATIIIRRRYMLSY